jgi:hypothetical protein
MFLSQLLLDVLIGRDIRDIDEFLRQPSFSDLDDAAWANAPARHIEFSDMVEHRKEQLLAWKGTPRMREEEFCCYSDDEVRRFALDMRSLLIYDRTLHLVICG